MRKSIHIHLDSPFFSGAEGMVANLLADENFRANFHVTLSYRRGKADFLRELRGRVSDLPVYYELNPSIGDLILDSSYELGHLSFGRKLLVVALLPLTYFQHLTALIKILKKTSPDLIHVNSGGFPGAVSTRAAPVAARMSGIQKCLMVINNIPVRYSSLTRILEWPVDQAALRCTDFFVSASRYVAHKINTSLGVPISKVSNIPNGVALKKPSETRKEFVSRHELGDTGRKIFGVVAILEPRKGHKTLLLALASIVDVLKKFNTPMPMFLFEGFGPSEKELRFLAESLGVQNIVKFVGREPRIENFIANLDCLILPSVGGEDLPNVVSEAMSLGVPVIGSRIAGIPEQVLNGKTGYLTEPSDVRSLGQAILSVYSGGPEVQAMPKLAKERYQEMFTPARATSDYTKLYLKLLDR
jgi:glycosyltransferase involved in cell wall biosynthesis